MFSWQIRKEAFCKANAQKIWNIFTQLSRMPEWNETVEWCKLFGPLQVGSQGELKMYGRPVLKFMVTELKEGSLYKDEAKIPGATLAFTHELIPVGNGTKIIHTFTASGILAPLYRLIIYKRINASMPQALNNLVSFVEKET